MRVYYILKINQLLDILLMACTRWLFGSLSAELKSKETKKKEAGFDPNLSDADGSSSKMYLFNGDSWCSLNESLSLVGENQALLC